MVSGDEGKGHRQLAHFCQKEIIGSPIPPVGQVTCDNNMFGVGVFRVDAVHDQGEPLGRGGITSRSFRSDDMKVGEVNKFHGLAQHRFEVVKQALPLCNAHPVKQRV